MDASSIKWLVQLIFTADVSLFCRFPAPILPKVGQWEEMLGTAFSLAVVGYVINLAMGRTLAAKHGYDVDPNQVGKLLLIKWNQTLLM